MTTRFAPLCAVILLAGCGSTTGGTAGGLLSGSGGFTTPLANPSTATVPVGTSGGYAYQVGALTDNSGLGAEAVLLPGTTLGPVPPSGTAMMSGRFHVKSLQNPVMVNGVLDGTQLDRTQPITLAVDFGAGTLAGSNAGLALNGQIAGNGGLNGTATFGGMSGTLQGGVGADTAIGVFQGSDATGVFAGGFSASK